MNTVDEVLKMPVIHLSEVLEKLGYDLDELYTPADYIEIIESLSQEELDKF